MSMYTYTTPTIPCKLKNLDFTYVDYVRIAIYSERAQIVRQVPASEFDENGVVLVQLTQEETAAFGEGCITIQCRIRFQDGSVLPTKKIKTTMEDVIDKVVI